MPWSDELEDAEFMSPKPEGEASAPWPADSAIAIVKSPM